ncbi:MAG: 30S ribosomal protein S16 [Rikenellaceae bacterium]|nr:30S ribosomal protein S16 [Rikenellaceae bacterium]MCL2691979.1 30S ribosomal protein S16 [Rikenellaceae bacterium]
MATKIRLARHGKKGYAFYHIVVADSRAPRDGKFIEKLGTYNPNTNPATIELNFDRTVDWVMKGAQPTDTTRAILSYKGVMLKKHLLGGVAKGALTESEADARLEKWMNEKAGKVDAKANKLSADKAAAERARKAGEVKANEEKAKAIAAKKAAIAGVAASEEGESSPSDEDATSLEALLTPQEEEAMAEAETVAQVAAETAETAEAVEVAETPAKVAEAVETPAEEQ